MNPYDPPLKSNVATGRVLPVAPVIVSAFTLGVAAIAMLHFSTFTTTYSPNPPGATTISVSTTVTTLTPFLYGGIALAGVASLLFLAPVVRYTDTASRSKLVTILLLTGSSFFAAIAILTLANEIRLY